MSYRYVYCMCIYIYIHIVTSSCLLHHHVVITLPSIHCSGQAFSPTDAPLASALGLSQPGDIQHVSPILSHAFSTSGACTLHCVKAYHSGPHLTKKPGAVSIRSMSSSATALRSQKGRRKTTKHLIGLIGLLCPRDRRPCNIFI